ncbi:hypothetical protein Tco_0944931 [Tanacetum coccineum]
MSDSEDSIVTYTAAPPSPDYVPGPEEPERAPLLPEFVPKPVYLEFMPSKDEVFPAKEQPLPAAVSPTAESPGGDNDDDDDDESSNDDEDDDDDVEEDEDKEEEEHPATADFVLPPVYRVTARMLIRDEPPIPFWSEAKIYRLLDIPSPPPLPLSPWSSLLPQIPSPPLLVSSPTPSTSHPPPSSTPSSGTPSLLPIPLPTPSPPLLLPSTNHRADVCEVYLPPLKRLCFTLGPRYEVGESSSAPTARPTGGFRMNYGFVSTLDGAPATDETELGGSKAVKDCRVASSKPHLIDITCGDIDTDEDTADTCDSSLESAGTR